jgi:hypothetical protein
MHAIRIDTFFGNRLVLSICESKWVPKCFCMRRSSSLRHGLRAEDALETFAVLKKDQYPQYRRHESGSNAGWRKRQVKRKDVVEFRRQQCERKRDKVARKQQQPTEHLNREEECGEVRCADRDKKLNRERIRRRRLVDEVEKSIEPENDKDQPQYVAR